MKNIVKFQKRHNHPKHLHRPPSNPNSLSNKIAVAVSTANRWRIVPEITLSTPPWVGAQDEQQEAAHG